MTPTEVKKLLSWTTANFPNMQEREMRPTAELWLKMLSDIPYKLAEAAILKILSVNKFFPTIAEIREAAFDLSNPQEKSALEAWDQTIKIARTHGWTGYHKAMEAFDPEVREVVKLFGYEDICKTTEIGITKAQFIRLWNEHRGRIKEQQIIPEAVKTMLADVIKNPLQIGEGKK